MTERGSTSMESAGNKKHSATATLVRKELGNCIFVMTEESDSIHFHN